MKKEKKPITYQVDWIRDGWCYRTTCGVPKEVLKQWRQFLPTTEDSGLPCLNFVNIMH